MSIKCVGARATDKFALYQGDSCEVLPQLPSESVGYMIFSPPFSSLYTYSNSERDLGNCQTVEEFLEHYKFIAAELYRLLKPGRLLSFHCMLLPTSKERDGFIGLTDFRGQLIKSHQDAGFIFHSEVVIWKDPVTAMQRTKALGLLHKQILKDSCMSRQGIPDYVITMRKPGVNAPEDAVSGPFEEWIGDPGLGPNPAEYDGSLIRKSIAIWQRYASPVWMDIHPGDTLQKESARDQEDERHICPLQLGVIRRCMELWSNPGDVVLSPFAGIGSEGYVALQQGRKFIGVELKESYWRQAALNLIAAGNNIQGSLEETAPSNEDETCQPTITTPASADTPGMSIPGVLAPQEDVALDVGVAALKDALDSLPPSPEKKKKGRPRKAQTPTDQGPIQKTWFEEIAPRIVIDKIADDVPDWVK